MRHESRLHESGMTLPQSSSSMSGAVNDSGPSTLNSTQPSHRRDDQLLPEATQRLMAQLAASATSSPISSRMPSPTLPESSTAASASESAPESAPSSAAPIIPPPSSRRAAIRVDNDSSNQSGSAVIQSNSTRHRRYNELHPTTAASAAAASPSSTTADPVPVPRPEQPHQRQRQQRSSNSGSTMSSPTTAANVSAIPSPPTPTSTATSTSASIRQQQPARPNVPMSHTSGGNMDWAQSLRPPPARYSFATQTTSRDNYGYGYIGNGRHNGVSATMNGPSLSGPSNAMFVCNACGRTPPMSASNARHAGHHQHLARCSGCKAVYCK